MTHDSTARIELGTFSVPIEIGDDRGERFEQLEALVDTGATTTVIPGGTLRRLGIVPTKQETFEYAGGTRVELGMAETNARVEGRETTTWVTFGEEESSALLGAYTRIHTGKRILRLGPLRPQAHPCARPAEASLANFCPLLNGRWSV